MEFFVENWLWFLVASIVILMTLIGYIAEKTDFGRKDVPKKEKPKKEKKEKKEPKANQELTEVLQTEIKPEVQMTLATDSILEEPVNIEEQLNNTENLEDLTVPFGDVTFDEPVESLGEEIFVEPTFEQSTESLEVSPEQPEETVNVQTIADLDLPFEEKTFNIPDIGIEEVVAEEPNDELKLDTINNLNVELPDLDSIVTEEDSDDVWKF